ncbi:MAG: hypothetical protein ACN6NX_08365 [Acinetobacter sp.]
MWTLLIIILMAWIVPKCIPLTKKKQDSLIRSNIERQRLRLAQEFDIVKPEERARLPKFDSRKYALEKRNGRFWLIPRQYYGDTGFNINWPDTVNEILGKKWKNEFGYGTFFKISMYSPQYYYGDLNTFNHESCSAKTGRFKWNGILIRIYNAHFVDVTNEQYLDICLTALKILNEELKELKEN